MSVESFNQVAEERFARNTCCNLQCVTLIDPAIVISLSFRKFNITKSGLEENKDPRVFCDKKKGVKFSACEEEYKR